MSFADKKGIVVASGFKLQAEVLLDARQQVDTIQERDELVTIHAATPGLRVYVKADNTSYVYNGTSWDKLTTGNAYVHPTGDGNHHVPATGTTNNGKVLMAGSTAGSESWQTLTTDDISDFPDSLPTPNNLVVKFNGGASEGNNQFTFNGSAAKTVNITPAAIGASASNHTHTHTSITDFDDAVGDLLPTELPNPEALTISLNGTSQGAYNGSAAKTVNITPASIGASASNHTHTHTSITDFDDAVGELLPTIPTKLPNPEALTISLNGTSQGAYNGSAAKSINITPASIGAAASSHTHAGTQVTGLTANRAMISNGSGQLAVSAVTSTELGYLDGVTSSIQTQLNGKAASSHTHNYAGSSSAGGAATSANKVNSDLVIRLNGGTTEGSNQFTFNGSGDKTINITPASIGAAASSHGTHVTYGTAAPLANGTASAGSAASVSRSDHVHPLQTTISGNAGSATKLATTRTIDGVSFNGTANITHFGTCSTAAATAAKVVSCTGFTLATGAVITVKFSATNTAASPTLNVNSTGAKAIMYRGSAISAGYLAANRVYTFVYDGTDYELIGDINTDTNTTYSTGTATKAGITKLYTGTGSNTDGTMTQSAITTALNGKAASSHTHTSANITDFEEAVEELLPTIPTKLPNPYTLTFTGAVSTTYDGSAARTVNIPTSGSTDADLVIKLNGGTTEGTNQFTFDGSTAKTVNITASSIGAAASSHNHSAANITSGTLGVARGGTGVTANPSMLVNLASTSAASVFATSPRPGVTGALGIANGGTGATTAAAARTALGAAASSHTHTGAQVTGLTASRALVSNSSGAVTVSAVTSTELGYLDGVTSSIQTQLNGKAASSHTHKYAGSSSAGGAANSAVKLTTARKLNGVSFNGTADVYIPNNYFVGLTNQDLNTYNTYDKCGEYYSAGGTKCTNIPSGTDHFYLRVFKAANYHIGQMLYSEGKLYTRHYNSSSWSSWVTYYSTGKKPTASEIGAAASSHNHSATNITSGTLAVARGGTGITSNPSMLVNLGSTSAASVFAASPRPGITGTLSIAHGGTGATTAAAARSALGAAAASHTHKYAGSSSAGGAATVANKINLPVGTTLFATSSSATFFSATLGGTWTVVGNIDTIVVSSGTALTLYLHRKTAS